MSNAKEVLKPEIEKFRRVLDELGISMKQNHLFEIFSRMNGFKSWHVMSKEPTDKVIQVLKSIKGSSKHELVALEKENPGSIKFELKLRALAEVSCYVRMKADTPQEAIDIALNSSDDVKFEDWSVTFIEQDPRVVDVQEMKKAGFYHADESGINNLKSFNLVWNNEVLESELNFADACRYKEEYTINPAFSKYPVKIVPSYDPHYEQEKEAYLVECEYWLKREDKTYERGMELITESKDFPNDNKVLNVTSAMLVLITEKWPDKE